MNNPIIDKDLLQCNKGTEQTPIQVTSQNFAVLAGKLQATEEDKQDQSDIIPFGQCKLKPTSCGYLPCSPALIKWQKNISTTSLNLEKDILIF